MVKLSPEYIAGFTDGEGCFALTFRRDYKGNRRNKPEYFYWKTEFAIALRSDDEGLLRHIQDYLDCGKITFTKGSARYSVQNLDELKNVIIPFFRKHRLFGKKWQDFLLWAEAVEILAKYKPQDIALPGIQGFVRKQWSKEDLKRMEATHEAMRPLKSKRNPIKWLHKLPK